MGHFRTERQEVETVLLNDGITSETFQGDVVTHQSNVTMAGDVDLTVTYLPPVTDILRALPGSEAKFSLKDALKQHVSHDKGQFKDSKS